MTREQDQEDLSAALRKVRTAWADLRSSLRDWSLLGNDPDGADHPSSMLHMLMVEQADEARRLYLAASDAVEALERMGFTH